MHETPTKMSGEDYRYKVEDYARTLSHAEEIKAILNKNPKMKKAVKAELAKEAEAKTKAKASI